MRWGLVARPETGRGLGVQTYGLYSNLNPDSVLLVNTADKYDKDFSRYKGAWVTDFRDGKLSEEFVRDWLADLDVVVGVETLYDPRIYDWAKAANCRTVIQMNPEFVKPNGPLPDVVWLPTGWRRDAFPTDGVRIVRYPIEAKPVVLHPEADEPVRFLHVAGKPALADRNGTDLFSTALRRVKGDAVFTVTTQGHEPPGLAGKAEVLFNPSYDEMYQGNHVLVLPRRYGGNCLPVNEAIAHGMAIIMSDIDPNREWPIYPVATQPGRVIDMPCGSVRLYDADPVDLPNVIQTLANNRTTLASQMHQSVEYAVANSWHKMKQFYYDELELASAADYRPSSRTRPLQKARNSDLGVITRSLPGR